MILLVLLWSTPVLGETREYCLFETLSLRQGRERCWVKYRVNPREAICIPREEFKRALQDKARCFRWKEKLRITAHRSDSVRKSVNLSQIKTRVSVLTLEDPHPLSSEKDWLSNRIREIERIREEIGQRIRPFDRFTIVRKLILDERTSSSPEPLLRSLGFVHLVSASGIHLYSLAKLLENVGSKILATGALSARNCLWLSRLGAMVAWIAVWMLSGLRVGMLRPWLVGLIRLTGTWFGVKWTLWSPLLIALSLDGAISLVHFVQGVPRVTGWLHYSLAVGGGLTVVQMRKKSWTTQFGFKDHVALSVGSWLFTAPLDLLLEGSVSFATPILSLTTIPVFCSVIFPGVLVGLVTGWEQLTSSLVIFANEFVSLLAEGVMLLAFFWSLKEKVWIAIPLGFAAAVLVSTLKAPVRFLLIVILIVTCRLSFEFRENEPRVTQLDIGQGDAAIVFGERSGMIDLGSPWSMNSKSWMRVLGSYGLDQIDWVFLTHLDLDHIGSLMRLLSIIPIKCVETSQDSWKSSRGKRLKFLLSQREVEVAKCMNKRKLMAKTRGGRSNNDRSQGVLVPLSFGAKYLNLGDSNSKRELRLIQKMRLSSPIYLKISHHGSKHSSSTQLLRTGVREAVISSGYRNSYGHPSPSVIRRLVKLKIPIWRTDLMGDRTYQ